MPIHPSLIHFPIVLLVLTALGYWLTSLKQWENHKKLVDYLHIATIAFLALGIFSGENAESQFPHTTDIQELLERHALLAWIVGWSAVVLYVWQMLRTKQWKTAEQYAYNILFTVLCAVLLFSAHIGGEMVYEKGAGVIPMKPILEQERNK